VHPLTALGIPVAGFKGNDSAHRDCEDTIELDVERPENPEHLTGIVGILAGHSAVPQGKPREVSPMPGDVARNGDEIAFHGTELVSDSTFRRRQEMDRLSAAVRGRPRGLPWRSGRTSSRVSGFQAIESPRRAAQQMLAGVHGLRTDGLGECSQRFLPGPYREIARPVAAIHQAFGTKDFQRRAHSTRSARGTRPPLAWLCPTSRLRPPPPPRPPPPRLPCGGAQG